MKTTSISEQNTLIKKSANCLKLFGFNCPFEVPYFAKKSDLVPVIDKGYIFNEETTIALLAGFTFNKRILISGYHGTGKSSHIEQIAARLNWPCLRINLDSHISRIDLIGKDAITIQDGQQITYFKEGLLPFALQHNIALILDEYDAGRPDVLFVLQRLLEHEGKLTLLEDNRVIEPHPFFRLFATANTVGLGDNSGLYHGTQQMNQAQMDRWSMVVNLNYLPAEIESKIIQSKVKYLRNNKTICEQMVAMANLTRSAFQNGDISTVMSPRTVLIWAQNSQIFNDIHYAFKVSFLNKCDDLEKPIFAEFYQRIFNYELEDYITNLNMAANL